MDLKKHEEAERKRSAIEASQFKADLKVSRDALLRYFNPPENTYYPLEYSFHLLGEVTGKIVLDYGCGDGLNSLVMAWKGAHVLALEISPELMSIARKRLQANGVLYNIDYIIGSGHTLPFADESIDIVFGIAILHHLDLSLAQKEIYRVLRKGGKAIFQEPVRNSALVRFIRKMIPYRSPNVSEFERPLTDEELEDFGRGFSSYKAKAFTFPTTNLIALLPYFKHYVHHFYRLDAKILEKIPSLGYYASIRVIELVK